MTDYQVQVYLQPESALGSGQWIPRGAEAEAYWDRHRAERAKRKGQA